MEEKLTILLADDEPMTRKLLKTVLLKNKNVEIVEVADGQAALETTQKIHPSVLVLDVEMPEMSGFEVCRRLREEPETKNQIIVILTGYTDNLQKEFGLALGADLYVTKPFDAKKTARIIMQLATTGSQTRTKQVLNKTKKRPLFPEEIEAISNELAALNDDRNT